jgi:hypothetical protein
MSQKIKNPAALAGLALVTLLVASCSPNSASVTKDALQSMQQKQAVDTHGIPVSVSLGSTQSPGPSQSSQASLQAVPMDTNDYNQQIERLASDGSVVAFTLNSDQLSLFKSTDESSVTVPSGVSLNSLLKNGGKVYLFVNDLEEVMQMPSLMTLLITLRRSAGDPSGWEIVTSNDLSVEQPLLDGLTQVVITMNKPQAPRPAPSPSVFPAIDPTEVITSTAQFAD